MTTDFDEDALHEQMMRDAHDLIPTSIAASIPALYATEGNPDPLCHIKLFTPDSNWTWWVIEYDPCDRLAFGLVEGFEAEMGYFSLEELESARGPLRLAPERDLWWEPIPLSEVRAGLDGGPVVGRASRF